MATTRSLSNIESYRWQSLCTLTWPRGPGFPCRIKKAHPRLKIIITGDGLYSKQPFINELKTAGMSYILVAKPTDHKILFEWVDELTGLGDASEFEVKDSKGKRYVYPWINKVPLNGTPGADEVNFSNSE